MKKLTAQPQALAQAQAQASDADAVLPDGDSPSQEPRYRLRLEQLHRYVASYADLYFTPLLRQAFRVVPISPSADAIQLKWGDWAAIISYVSASKPLFLESE